MVIKLVGHHVSFSKNLDLKLMNMIYFLEYIHHVLRMALVFSLWFGYWSVRHVSNLSLAVTNCLVFQLLFVLLVFSLILSRLSVIFQDNLLLSWYWFVFFFPVLSFWCLLVLLCSFQDFASYVIPLFCHYTKYCLVKAIWCQFDPSRPFFLVMHFEFLNFRILVNFFVLLGISLTEPI